MTIRSYIALIHKDEDSDFGVSFPDLPGCTTAGRSLDEARLFAEEALRLHLQGLAEDGDVVPDPASLDTVMGDVANREAVAVLVVAEEIAPLGIQVDITIPADVLGRIDAFVERHGTNRSDFLVRAAKLEMDARRSDGGG